MASVKAKFRKSRHGGKEGVVYFQLIHRRKIKLIATCFRLYPFEWDMQRSTVVITDNTDKERNLYLQNLMNSVRAEMQQVGDLIAVLDQRGDYTAEELAEYYVNQALDGYFFPFIKYRIKKLTSENRLKTASIYETTRRSFYRFRQGEDIRIEKIDGPLMQRYEAYLRDNRVCINSISCYMRALRGVYNQAVKKGLTVSKSPFRDVYTGIDKTSKRAVNEDVIAGLRRLDLAEDTGLQLARDFFIFSFFTRGMSFIDMANLRYGNLEKGYLVYSRSKTKQVLRIRLEQCIEDIIERYKGVTIDDYVLPVFTTQNRDYSHLLRTYNKRLKRLSEMLELEKPLSSYVSRHSWATIALRKGISVQVISEGMGHDNEKTTRIYLASLDQSVIDNANAHIISL
jgi:site-specific recombinase XerD